jgi:hypothetical protein
MCHEYEKYHIHIGFLQKNKNYSRGIICDMNMKNTIYISDFYKKIKIILRG